jgi:hypothetical protein
LLTSLSSVNGHRLKEFLAQKGAQIVPPRIHPSEGFDTVDLQEAKALLDSLI